jgi:hypothetical protein
VLAAFAAASSITLACVLDARMHGKVFLRSWAWLLMWTWPVGILAHLLWTRRARGIGMYFALFAGALATALAGFAARAILERL